MKKRIKFHGFLIFAATAAIIAFPGYLLSAPRSGEYGLWLNIFCAAVILWGYFMRISARGLKSEISPDGHALVTIGPYRVSRNPMYFGTFIIGLGISPMLFRWWVTLIFFFVYLAIYLPLIGREEQALAGRFGDTFKDYCQKTSKFFPRNLIFELPVKPAWIKKELFSSLAPAIVFIAAIQAWADFKFFGLIRYQERGLTIAIFTGLLLAYSALAALENKKHGVSGKS